MTKAQKEHLTARLYLHAVLPALRDLTRLCPDAAEIARQHRIAITFRVCSGLGAAITACEGSCEVQPQPRKGLGVRLFFFRDSHLNRLFASKQAIPLPVWGWHALPSLFHFSKLAALLTHCLKPKAEDLSDPAFLQTHVQLTLDVALAGAAVLALHEEQSRNAMRKTPNGLAVMRVENANTAAWFRWENPEATWGSGAPPSPPDVILSFDTHKTALGVLQNQIDIIAAAGLQRVKLQGSIPLADAMTLVMDRLPLYLDV